MKHRTKRETTAHQTSPTCIYLRTQIHSLTESEGLSPVKIHKDETSAVVVFD